MTGLVNILSLNPNLQAINKAKVVGKTVFDVLERKPLICDLPDAIKEFNL